MRYFTLLDFQHWVLALFLGLVAVIFVYIAWRFYPVPEGEGESVGERLPTGHRPGSHPIAPVSGNPGGPAPIFPVAFAPIPFASPRVRSGRRGWPQDVTEMLHRATGISRQEYVQKISGLRTSVGSMLARMDAAVPGIQPKVGNFVSVTTFRR